MQKKTTTKVRAVTVAVLSDALDKAWENVQASGARFEGNAEDARTLLAKHIVDLALLGERNRDRLIMAHWLGLSCKACNHIWVAYEE